MPPVLDQGLTNKDRFEIAFGVLAFVLASVSIILGLATWHLHRQSVARRSMYISSGDYGRVKQRMAKMT